MVRIKKLQSVATEEIEAGKHDALSYNKSRYERLLEEAIKIGKQHQTQANHFVPKMYDLLVRYEGFPPVDAAAKIYRDLADVWKKDTLRRLIPAEAKDQAARRRQALSRQSMTYNSAGVVLRPSVKPVQENAILRKKIEELDNRKRMDLEKILKLEKIIAMQQMQGQEKGKLDAKQVALLPPHLFIKIFTLIRGCSRPLVLTIAGNEVIEIDRTN